MVILERVEVALLLVWKLKQSVSAGGRKKNPKHAVFFNVGKKNVQGRSSLKNKNLKTHNTFTTAGYLNA